LELNVFAIGVMDAALWFLVPALLIVMTHWAIYTLVGKEASEETKNAASWASRRIGVVLALVLSLVFSDVRSEYNELQETIDNEALAIEQLYRLLDGIDLPGAGAVQDNLATYTKLVVEEEWPSMRAGQPLEQADRLVDEIYRQVMQLGAATDNSGLASALLNDINDLENARGQRSFDIEEPISPMFWLIAIVGFVLTSVSFFPTKPGILRSTFLGMFAGMNGLVFFAILSFTNPFDGAFQVQPDALNAVLKRTIDVSR
jgi:hypothetical protein